MGTGVEITAPLNQPIAPLPERARTGELPVRSGDTVAEERLPAVTSLLIWQRLR
jgi:hypothetical protein